MFMKVWEDLVYLLTFCQLCKMILVYHWRSSLFITLEILENKISLLGGLLKVLLLLLLKDGGIGG